MPPITPVTCGSNDVGPFPVWSKENKVSSFNPQKGIYEFKYVCLPAEYKNGILKTKHFELKGSSIFSTSFDSPWEPANPRVTSNQFDLFFAGFAMEEFVNYLSAIKVYPDIEKVFLKLPIQGEISTTEDANARFSHYGYLFYFGMVKNLCKFAADLDVVVHEFWHLITYSNNRGLGGDYGDIEGNAMHEGISDGGAAICAMDPEIGESVAVCLGVKGKESPELGLRNVNISQLSLFYDKESHGRAEMYSSVLWFSFVKLTELLTPTNLRGDENARKEAARKARDMMIILIGNMARYMPAAPQKSDFIKGFFNAFISKAKKPDFQSKYSFNVPDFLNYLLDEARYRRIIETDEDRKNAFSLVQNVKKRQLARILGDFSKDGITFKPPESANGDVAFYQEYFKGVPVEGAGIRLINQGETIQVVPMIADSLNAKIVHTPAKALEILSSIKTQENALNLLKPQIKQRAVTEGEVNQIVSELQKLKIVGPPVEIFLSGKPNLQYKFILKGVTCYVDSVDGSVSFYRQRFY